MDPFSTIIRHVWSLSCRPHGSPGVIFLVAASEEDQEGNHLCVVSCELWYSSSPFTDQSYIRLEAWPRVGYIGRTRLCVPRYKVLKLPATFAITVDAVPLAPTLDGRQNTLVL